LFVNGDINHYEPSFIEETAFRENNYSIKEATGYRDLFVGGNLNKIGELSLKNWYDILAAVEDTRLIIAPFNPNWQSEYNVTDFKAWLDQLAEENSIRRERIVLIGPFPTRKPILDHIAKATLYLDSFPYSGAVSIMDPILTNTAFITIKGEPARFRQASLMAARYPALGISTDSSTAYTNKAIETLSAKAFSTNSEITEALQAESVDTSSTLAAEVASIIEYL
jgi:predicted O-linked N-acetylglucosamine transferase (SPINDLY family)